MSIVYEIEQSFKRLNAIGIKKYNYKKYGHKIKNIHSGSTMKQYISICIRFARWAKIYYEIKHICDLRCRMVAHFLTDLIIEGYSTWTLQKYRSALRKLERAVMLTHHYHIRLVPKNFKLPVRNLSLRINRCAYTTEEVAKIFYCAETLNPLGAKAIYLIYRFGLRIHELLQLRPVDFELREGYIIVFRGKGGLYRKVPIRAKGDLNLLLDLLGEKAKMDLIFPLTITYMEKLMKKACKIAGIEVHHLHNLRHSFAVERIYELVGNGTSIKEAKQQVSIELGHRRIDIVNVYLPRQLRNNRLNK